MNDVTRQALDDYLTITGALAVAQTDEHGTILSANDTFERLAGRPLTGRAIHELVTAEQHPALQQLLDSTELRWHQRTLGLFPDHRGIPLDYNVACRPLDDRRLLIAEPLPAAVKAVNERLLALNDELVAAQRQIARQNAELVRHNDRLQELDRLKDALLANVSHDLRTPLTAILGYAELLRRRGGLTDRQAQAVDVIDRNARRLLRLVSDLLVLAQARAGMLGLDREPVGLAEIAAHAVELTDPLAEHAGLDLTLEAPPSGPVIAADPARLAQMLDNLIANAIKFTPQGGAVSVRVLDLPAAAVLEVADTGPGIAEAEQAALFEPFARGSGAVAPGTGLGLTIVKAIADAHQATIEVHSAPCRGARFTITFRRPPGT